MAQETPIYFDNAATTPLWPEVAQWLASPQLFGNPSSAHAQGRKAKALLQKARRFVAEDLDVDPSWVIFTASATESDNLAITGSARAIAAQRGDGAPLHFVCSALEHPAVLAPLERLAAQGHALCTVEPNAQGQIDASDLLDKVREDTALVSLMAVHNELGLIFPVAQVGAALAGHEARLHCDGVQAMATQDLRPVRDGIDLLTLTAHKIGGPKGVGVLVRDPKLAIEPLCVGGGQESALRPGTENPGMAYAFALALRTTLERKAKLKEHYAALGRALVAGLRAQVPGLVAIADIAACAPHIVTVCLPGHQGRALVQAFDEQGFCVSAGSACHANDPSARSSAQRVGVHTEAAKGMLRVSLGPHNTLEEVQAFLDCFGKLGVGS